MIIDQALELPARGVLAGLADELLTGRLGTRAKGSFPSYSRTPRLTAARTVEPLAPTGGS